MGSIKKKTSKSSDSELENENCRGRATRKPALRTSHKIKCKRRRTGKSSSSSSGSSSSSSSSPECRSSQRKTAQVSSTRKMSKTCDKRCRSSSGSSSTSSSSSSSDEERRRKVQKKRAKKEKKRLKKAKKKLKKLQKQMSVSTSKASSDEEVIGPMVPAAGVGQAMKPMTKEEWEKQQSEVRRVTDPETGRSRLVRGRGEILEEAVSRQRHQQINREATRNDGASFQKEMAKRLAR
ncbi:ADP-ribosylation factor-like protein 6-interacting protein 4 isoform X2 [Pollicipes pollicipes]|nr:ADP-ribosylation factor-like protein 6-interacting protein 4 isoform X2 [Pollicipes pollicipes]XP_037091899.1 ADP-ribosylation factor-like protein 6-interacting protein 4 isoform X2 [Pollicipes pollicipes]XP_037091900.1 ADP-ribosylation factor-like protein 6-interacting protein 4 isoform X2 [Pollicipes pollicipes]